MPPKPFDMFPKVGPLNPFYYQNAPNACKILLDTSPDGVEGVDSGALGMELGNLMLAIPELARRETAPEIICFKLFDHLLKALELLPQFKGDAAKCAVMPLMLRNVFRLLDELGDRLEAGVFRGPGLDSLVQGLFDTLRDALRTTFIRCMVVEHAVVHRHHMAAKPYVNGFFKYFVSVLRRASLSSHCARTPLLFSHVYFIMYRFVYMVKESKKSSARIPALLTPSTESLLVSCFTRGLLAIDDSLFHPYLLYPFLLLRSTLIIFSSQTNLPLTDIPLRRLAVSDTTKPEHADYLNGPHFALVRRILQCAEHFQVLEAEPLQNFHSLETGYRLKCKELLIRVLVDVSEALSACTRHFALGNLVPDFRAKVHVALYLRSFYRDNLESSEKTGGADLDAPFDHNCLTALFLYMSSGALPVADALLSPRILGFVVDCVTNVLTPSKNSKLRSLDFTRFFEFAQHALALLSLFVSHPTTRSTVNARLSDIGRLEPLLSLIRTVLEPKGSDAMVAALKRNFSGVFAPDGFVLPLCSILESLSPTPADARLSVEAVGRCSKFLGQPILLIEPPHFVPGKESGSAIHLTPLMNLLSILAFAPQVPLLWRVPNPLAPETATGARGSIDPAVYGSSKQARRSVANKAIGLMRDVSAVLDRLKADRDSGRSSVDPVPLLGEACSTLMDYLVLMRDSMITVLARAGAELELGGPHAAFAGPLLQARILTGRAEGDPDPDFESVLPRLDCSTLLETLDLTKEVAGRLRELFFNA